MNPITKRVNWRVPIVIDFETYYDKDYSLSKLTTEKYIRCDQFECIGLSVKVGNNPTYFHPMETGISFLKAAIRNYPDSPVVAHNAPFDAAILAWRYDIHPAVIVDTVMMAKSSGFDRIAGGASLAKLSAQMERMGICEVTKGTTVADMLGVHAADMSVVQWRDYGEYCKRDTELCYQLYKWLLPNMLETELHMANITYKMATKPMVELNVPLLESYARKLEADREGVLSSVASQVGMTNEEMLSNLRSQPKFSAMLEKLGCPVPLKWSEKKNDYTPALAKTDDEFQALREHPNPLVRALVEAKLGVSSSMEQTRTATFLDIASRGRMPIPLRYAAAHTGRYGGSDKVNVQNLSKRTKEPVLRRSMGVPDGYAWVAADSSQIEARLNAYISGQDDLVQLFLDGGDPYVDMATEIFGKSYDEIYHAAKVEPTKEGKHMRNMGKEACLACGYGMSVNTFRYRMNLAGNTEAANMADTIVTAYRRKNHRIVEFWRTCQNVLEEMVEGRGVYFGGKDGRLFRAEGGLNKFGKRMPFILLPDGTKLIYQNLRREYNPETGRYDIVYDQFKGNKFIPTRIWGSMLAENLCQALAFCALKWQALNISERGFDANLNVHDEWAAIVEWKHIRKAIITFYQCMRQTPEYLPDGLFDCEVDIGLNYADLVTIPNKVIEQAISNDKLRGIIYA